MRRVLHARGLRFRVAYPVPGMSRRTIDIAFPRARVAVFVHGCFWHGCPTHGTQPKANAVWWAAKIAGNIARDEETAVHLRGQTWHTLTVWEHEDPTSAAERVARLVDSVRRSW
jgi:DNA mismatch endonuclease (patch repair protein)